MKNGFAFGIYLVIMYYFGFYKISKGACGET
jgi:hypothetical protein